MDAEIKSRIGTPIPAVAEMADFGPAYNDEEYITITFRIPKDIPAFAGTWELIPRGPGTFSWAIQRYPVKDE